MKVNVNSPVFGQNKSCCEHNLKAMEVVMKRFLPFVMVVLLPLALFAGLTFQKTFGGLDVDVAYSVLELPDGNFLIIGYTKSFNAWGTDGYVVKMNKYGGAIWEKQIDLGGYEILHSGAVLNNGDVLLVGAEKPNENAPYDLLIIKIDPQGTKIWQRLYGGAESDNAWDIAAMPDGNFVISGTTKSYGAGDKDVWVLKINSDGDTLWTRTFGASGDDEGRSCAVDANGGIYVSAKSHLAFAPDMYMIKVNSDGSTGWLKSISTSGWTEGYGVCVVDTLAAFAGYGYWGSGISHDFFLVGMTTDGDTVGTAHGGGGDDDYAFSACATSDGAVVMAGKTFSFGGWCKGMLMKVKDGNIKWMQAYGGDDEDVLWDVIETSDHFYLAVGYTESFGMGNSDMFVVKTDTAGQFSAISENENLLPQNYSLQQNYPNPFNPSTVIPFTLPASKKVRVDVYNTLGQRVCTLGNRLYGAGKHQVTWNGTDSRGQLQPSGVYFYQLVVEGKVMATRKMVLMR